MKSFSRSKIKISNDNFQAHHEHAAKILCEGIAFGRDILSFTNVRSSLKQDARFFSSKQRGYQDLRKAIEESQ